MRSEQKDRNSAPCPFVYKFAGGLHRKNKQIMDDHMRTQVCGEENRRMCKKWALHGSNMRRRCNGRLLFSVVSSKKMWMNGRQRKKIDQALVQEHHIICHELMSPQPDQNKHVHCVFKCVSCTNSSIKNCNASMNLCITHI